MSESASGEAKSSTDTTDKEVTECPTCGQEFGTKPGMKVHHSKIHGESLAGVVVECVICGDKTRRKPYLTELCENHVCSKECESKWRSERFSGQTAPSWKGGHIEKDCVECGDVFESRPQREQKLCSDECRAKWVGRQQRGENHPMWKPNSVTPASYYGPNWNEQRKKALRRDQYRCRICGDTTKDLEREPDVHHIRQIAWYKAEFDSPDWYEKGNKLHNLICYCRPCHVKWEGIPLKPSNEK